LRLLLTSSHNTTKTDAENDLFETLMMKMKFFLSWKETSFSIRIQPCDSDDLVHHLHIPNLCYKTETGTCMALCLTLFPHNFMTTNACLAIQQGKCKTVIKAERFVVKLKKAEVGQEWGAIDDVDRQRKEDREKRIESGDLKGASTQRLLQDMYENADEEG